MLCNLQVRQAKAYALGVAMAVLLAVSSVYCMSLGAQQQGPLKTPPSSSAPQPQNKPDATATTPARCAQTAFASDRAGRWWSRWAPWGSRRVVNDGRRYIRSVVDRIEVDD